MKTKLIKQQWPSFLLILIAFCAGIAFFDRLPTNIPMHLNIRGEIDSYAPKEVALFLYMFVSIMTTLLIPFLLNYSPKDYQSKDDPKAIPTFLFLINLLLTSLFVLVAVGISKNHFNSWMGAFMLSMAWVLPKIQKNFFIGIRTPWSLTSDTNWKKTHALTSKLLWGAGVASIVVGIGNYPLTVSIVLLTVSLTIPAVYSFYMFYKMGS